MKNYASAIVVVLTLVHMAGCSVFMAAGGHDGPNLAALRAGTTRQQVEHELGNPMNVATTDTGMVYTYKFEHERKPKAGSAAVHAGMDVLTLGLWEVVGTPVEMAQIKHGKAIVTYDADDVVKSFTVR